MDKIVVWYYKLDLLERDRVEPPGKLYLYDESRDKMVAGEMWSHFQEVDYDPTTKTLTFGKRGSMSRWWPSDVLELMETKAISVVIKQYRP